MILAGDIGGTKSHLAFFNVSGQGLEKKAEKKYSSRDYKSLEAVIGEFTAETKIKPSAACFGLPGPILNEACQTTNLPWLVEARKISRQLDDVPVRLLNDLESTAYGISALREEEIVTLQTGKPGASGNRAVLAPGTGLGGAGLFWDGQRYHPIVCEPGHVSFAPYTELDVELMFYLKNRYGHVSWERVACGMGLVNIYEFLRSRNERPEPAWLSERFKKEDAAKVISECALEKKDDLCVQTLDLMVRYVASHAANIALMFVASGGVYIGGGIPPKILSKLKEPRFLEDFQNKGRMTPLLADMPLKVILNPDTALLGAALCGAALVQKN